MDFRREQGQDYHPPKHQSTIAQIETQLSECFAHPPPEHEKSKKLHKHLRVRQDQITRFLHDPQVPPDNNASERALRHFALLRKVFGGFRTLTGIQRYDVLLSISQSAKKQGLNVLDVLSRKVQLNFS